MKILITGGAGFIGSQIYNRCVHANHDVVIVDDLSTGKREYVGEDADLRVVNIKDERAVERIFEQERFDIVCHHAAQISVSASVRDPREDAAVNCQGWLNVLEGAAKYGCRRVIYAASGGTLYGNVTAPAREFSAIRPSSPYGITKYAGEQYLEFYAKRYGLETVSLRYGNVYGPRQNPHGEAGVVAIFCQKTLKGEPITVFGTGLHIRDYVYVKDVVDANVMAMTSNNILSGEMLPLNIGTGVGTYTNSIAAMVRRAVQTQFPAIPPNPILYEKERPGDLKSSILNPVWAYDKINWLPITKLADGIRDTVEWFGTFGSDNNGTLDI
jgi:UDP-glucose 4-epimerase